MVSNGKSGGIQITAGGNVTLAGAIAVGHQAAATITVLSDGDRERLRGSFGALKTLIAQEASVAPAQKSEITREIAAVEQMVEQKDGDAAEIRRGATGIVARINKICDGLQNRSGIFECLNTVIGVLGLAVTLSLKL